MIAITHRNFLLVIRLNQLGQWTLRSAKSKLSSYTHRSPHLPPRSRLLPSIEDASISRTSTPIYSINSKMQLNNPPISKTLQRTQTQIPLNQSHPKLTLQKR